MKTHILLLSAVLAAAACQTTTPPPPPTVVVPADYSLRDVQGDLKKMGYYRGGVDGINGPGTRRAVRQSQTDFGLPATGKADDALYERVLTYLRANPPHPDLPSGAQVFALQRALTRLGYYAGPVDGAYVGDTLQAYLSYQRATGRKITSKLSARELRRIEREAARG